MPPGVIGPCLPWAMHVVAAGEMVIIINHLEVDFAARPLPSCNERLLSHSAYVSSLAA